MTDREKLIELTNAVLRCLPWGEISVHTAEDIADHLIANGVTLATDNNVGDKTHADRIRAMSDEELEEEFTRGGLCRYIQDHDNKFCDERGDCTNCIKEWLKQPVGDE